VLNFLLSRETGEASDTKYTSAQRSCVHIKKNRLYQHATLRINYNTYDARRNQDTINPRTRPDCMILDSDPVRDDEGRVIDAHSYARVVFIFTADVLYLARGVLAGQEPREKTVDFCYVRWFYREDRPRPFWTTSSLPSFGFPPADDRDAFGVIHPDDIVRACHMIPSFEDLRTTDGEPSGGDFEPLGPSIVRRLPDDAQDNGDWHSYYANM
jgi:hypothetical protein